ncbi:AMIN-like domain-containing (lipo)protein [Rugosimonospora africana]|uniref:AMIN-like domain-containing protein n=1 Tax=Rugosimonospora africana TaxID=556532 RepID=A0A8J3VSU0_9ACTN|nr:hypothetical protein [Rugosimonospora africana]GIH17485.1 hypothetical protein Raf01_56570 [Rugosimonospora africana]
MRTILRRTTVLAALALAGGIATITVPSCTSTASPGPAASGPPATSAPSATSTVAAASTVVPSTVIPSTAIPSTVVPSTVASDLPAPAGTAPVTGTATADPWGPTPPVLTGVRTGRHANFDRTVFDFTGGTPGFRVEYGDLRQEGTGALVPLAGAAHLHVEFTGAYTRDPRTGAGRFDLHTVANPALPTLRQVRFGGEFEAHIAAGLGLTHRAGFRAFALSNPPRVVVDVAH